MADDWDRMKADVCDALDGVIEAHGRAIRNITIGGDGETTMTICLDLIDNTGTPPGMDPRPPGLDPKGPTRPVRVLVDELPDGRVVVL